MNVSIIAVICFVLIFPFLKRMLHDNSSITAFTLFEFILIKNLKTPWCRSNILSNLLIVWGIATFKLILDGVLWQPSKCLGFGTNLTLKPLLWRLNFSLKIPLRSGDCIGTPHACMGMASTLDRCCGQHIKCFGKHNRTSSWCNTLAILPCTATFLNSIISVGKLMTYLNMKVPLVQSSHGISFWTNHNYIFISPKYLCVDKHTWFIDSKINFVYGFDQWRNGYQLLSYEPVRDDALSLVVLWQS